ncbi:unnamed protein product [Pylaiella littoralis]
MIRYRTTPPLKNYTVPHPCAILFQFRKRRQSVSVSIWLEARIAACFIIPARFTPSRHKKARPHDEPDTHPSFASIAAVFSPCPLPHPPLGWSSSFARLAERRGVSRAWR